MQNNRGVVNGRIMETKGNDEALLRDISNSIKDLVAPDPPPGQPTRQCFVMKTGFSINPAEYDPTEAEYAAGLKLATLFDEIPKISPSWEPSGSHITFLWHDVLLTTGKALDNPPRTAEQKAQYEEAKRKLYKKNGEKTLFYKSLDIARKEVEHKQLELYLLRNKIKKMLGPNATKEEVDQLYGEMSPAYIDAVKAAQKHLMNRQREIDRFTVVYYEYSTGSLENILQNLGASKFELGYATTKGTLGTALLSFLRRLSLSRRLRQEKSRAGGDEKIFMWPYGIYLTLLGPRRCQLSHIVPAR